MYFIQNFWFLLKRKISVPPPQPISGSATEQNRSIFMKQSGFGIFLPCICYPYTAVVFFIIILWNHYIFLIQKK